MFSSSCLARSKDARPFYSKLTMVKWTEDITYKFVQEYLKHGCLYNYKDPKFKLKGPRETALRQISVAMNLVDFGSKEAYTKIRNLKSTYSQEAKKIRQSKVSGVGPDDVYIPNIKWFKLLDDALNAINADCSDSPSNMELADSKHDLLDEDEPATFQHIQYAEKHYPDATPDFYHNPIEMEHRKSPIPRKRTLRDLNRLVNKVKNVAETMNTSSTPSTPSALSTPTQTETEFDIFGRSVAAQLKSMPMHLAIQGQMFIQNYLCNLRLQQMGHGTSNVNCPSPNSVYQP